MAFAVTALFSWVDGKSKETTSTIRIPTSFSITQGVEFVQAMAQLLLDASDCALTGVSLNFALDVTAGITRTVISFFADVAQKALFQFRSSVAGFFNKQYIPTYNDNLTIVGTDQIDVPGSPAAAYVTAMEDGYTVSVGTIAPVDKRGNDLEANNIARAIFSARTSGSN